MSNTEILEQALKLHSTQRAAVVEGILESLDIPDKEVDDIWAEEAEMRLTAYRQGKLKGIPMEEIFASEI